MSDLFLILPAGTLVQRGIYPSADSVELQQATATKVSPGYIYGNAFIADHLRSEDGTPVVTGFPVDYVEAQTSEFISGETLEAAWANFNARK